MRRPAAEEGLRWLRQAQADLRWARLLAVEGGYHLACFIAQQVAEKALKALLYARGEEDVRGHSVFELGEAIAEDDAGIASAIGRWKSLDSYYIATRYPNGLPGGIPSEFFTREQAKSAVALAAEVVEAAQDRLSSR